MSENHILPSGWRKARLSDIADIRFSNVDKKTTPGEASVRLCNYVDVYNNEYVTRGLDFMEATATPNEMTRFSVQQGDVIITKDSETPDDIGVPAIVLDEIPGLVCGYHLALIKPNKQEVEPIFVGRQIGHERIAHYFSRLANGSTRYGLSASGVENAPLHLPPLPEQRKIAAILTTVDGLIEKTEALIGKYQSVKQGLMGDLFTRGVDPHGRLRPPRTEAPSCTNSPNSGGFRRSGRWSHWGPISKGLTEAGAQIALNSLPQLAIGACSRSARSQEADSCRLNQKLCHPI